MAIILIARAAQHHEPVVLVRAAGPKLRAGHPPSARCAFGARLNGSQVAAGAGLAHPDRERHLATADRRQEPLAKARAAVAQDQRSGLAIGDPVVANRRPPAQELLDDDETVHDTSLRPSISAGQGHAEPASRCKRAGEGLVATARHPQPRSEGPARQLGGEELPHLFLKRELGVGQLARCEAQHRSGQYESRVRPRLAPAFKCSPAQEMPGSPERDLQPGRRAGACPRQGLPRFATPESVRSRSSRPRVPRGSPCRSPFGTRERQMAPGSQGAPSPGGREQDYLDVIADHDALFWLTSQNQHTDQFADRRQSPSGDMAFIS